MTTHEDKPGWMDGARAVSPILLGVVPFGLIFGVTAATADVPTLAAWASSLIIFAGAAQIAIVEVMGDGGAPVVALITAVVINARHLMYSADMGRYASSEPNRVKLPTAYLLTDQAYLVSANRFPDPSSSVGFIPFYLGAGMTMWTGWQISTTLGFIVGTSIPKSWSLEFAVPLTFVALLVLAIKDRPGLVAAAFGGAVAVLGIGLPYHLGLLVGAAAGVASGMISERWLT